MLYLPSFGQNVNIKSLPQIRLTVWRGDGGGQGEPKIVPIERSTTYSYSLSVHITDLSCTVWPRYTTQRMTDRQPEGSEQAAFICLASALKTTFLPLDEAIAYRAVSVIVSESDERTDGRAGGNAFGAC